MRKRAKSAKGTRVERGSWEERQKKERVSLSPSEQGQSPGGEKYRFAQAALTVT